MSVRRRISVLIRPVWKQKPINDVIMTAAAIEGSSSVSEDNFVNEVTALAAGYYLPREVLWR